MTTTILMILILIIITTFISIFLYSFISWRKECKDFNNGYCKCCGEKLEWVCQDIFDGQLLECPKCGYELWIDWRYPETIEEAKQRMIKEYGIEKKKSQ